MKFLLVFLIGLLLAGIASGQHDTVVLNYYDLGQGVESWTLKDTASPEEVAHFCHRHQPLSPLEKVIIICGNKTIELSG